jgi:hypothetical protein
LQIQVPSILSVDLTWVLSGVAKNSPATPIRPLRYRTQQYDSQYDALGSGKWP